MLGAHELRVIAHDGVRRLFSLQEYRIIMDQVRQTQLMPTVLPGPCKVTATSLLEVFVRNGKAVIRTHEDLETLRVL